MSAVAHGRVCSVMEGMENSNQDREAMNGSWAAEYRANVQAIIEANRARLNPGQRAALDVAVARRLAMGDALERVKQCLSPEEFDALVPLEQWGAHQQTKALMKELQIDFEHVIDIPVPATTQERSN